MNRIFVTGGSGLVGRNLTDALDAVGVEYTAPTSSDVDLLNEAELREIGLLAHEFGVDTQPFVISEVGRDTVRVLDEGERCHLWPGRLISDRKTRLRSAWRDLVAPELPL